MFYSYVIYIDQHVQKWKNKQKVDTSYELKIDVNRDAKLINIYKVGEMGEPELTWNYLFSLQMAENSFILHLFLDVEDSIIESLNQSGYLSVQSGFMLEYKVSLLTFEDVQDFLDQHVWCFDPGYFY